jgi:hypothetical protein
MSRLLQPQECCEIHLVGKEPTLDLSNCDPENKMRMHSSTWPYPLCHKGWGTGALIEVGEQKERSGLGGVVETCCLLL